MRTIAGCVLMLSVVGCHCGPRCCVREQPSCIKASCANNSPAESTAKPATDDSQLPPSPAPNEPQAARTKKTQSGSAKPSMWSSLTARTEATSSAKSAAAKSATAQDDSVKQLLADLEKTKREKASLQAKLSEESARQTQQRLELETRMVVLQEQLRQQSALQQVMYQQQAPVMSRPQPNYGGQNYSGQNYGGQYAAVPTITPGSPSSAVAAGWPNSNGSNAPAPAWNPQAKPAQPLEQWPHSPQR